MKGSLTVVAFFCAGCLMGVANDFQFDLHDLSMYVLYALMFQVGIGIGSNKKLKELVKSLRPKMLLVPMARISSGSCPNSPGSDWVMANSPDIQLRKFSSREMSNRLSIFFRELL